MSATREFFRSWIEENVGNEPADTQISVPVLAQQFEQDADAAGYGLEVREEEIGNIEDAITRALNKTGEGADQAEPNPRQDDSLTPVVEALEDCEPKPAQPPGHDDRA
ncbi:MAG: DUF768 domain-containing protein [Mesorhizobium sp.]|nr:MAG: DUF768 domain-containing protein [Mesorhizobium sp.]